MMSVYRTHEISPPSSILEPARLQVPPPYSLDGADLRCRYRGQVRQCRASFCSQNEIIVERPGRQREERGEGREGWAGRRGERRGDKLRGSIFYRCAHLLAQHTSIEVLEAIHNHFLQCSFLAHMYMCMKAIGWKQFIDNLLPSELSELI